MSSHTPTGGHDFAYERAWARIWCLLQSLCVLVVTLLKQLHQSRWWLQETPAAFAIVVHLVLQTPLLQRGHCEVTPRVHCQTPHSPYPYTWSNPRLKVYELSSHLRNRMWLSKLSWWPFMVTPESSLPPLHRDCVKGPCPSDKIRSDSDKNLVLYCFTGEICSPDQLTCLHTCMCTGAK